MPPIADLHRAVYDAVQARDFDKLREIYHADCSYTTGDGVERRGVDAVLASVDAFTSAFPDLRIQVRHQHDSCRLREFPPAPRGVFPRRCTRRWKRCRWGHRQRSLRSLGDVRSGSSRIEPGLTPAVPITLRWQTFSDAASQAALSRRLGGIHFESGDLAARALGRRVGSLVWSKVRQFVEGSASAW